MPIKCDKCVYGQVKPECVIHYCEDCFDRIVLQINAIDPHYFQKCGCGAVRDLKITLEGAFCDACLAKQGA